MQTEQIPFTVGDKVDMWSKIMKEVKEKRFAGPFLQVPFNNYIQSPIGLVPKAGGKTRLIFHLSYNFSEAWQDKSVNHFIPKEFCSVKYQDLDVAVRACLQMAKLAHKKTGKDMVFLGKTDFLSAFRQIPLKKRCCRWLVMVAQDPRDNIWKYFVDKCLPFGSSISCAIYQCFSDAIRHIVTYKIMVICVINYLDDFLFVQYTIAKCQALMVRFLELCAYVNIPVSEEKTEWPTTTIVFLGNLLDGESHVIGIPIEKRDKAIRLLNTFRDKRKATVKQLQVLTGYLNFLLRAVFAGRAFTRRIYAKYSSTQTGKKKLKQYHHVSLDKEFRFDLDVWHVFLSNHQSTSICRPMVDLNEVLDAVKLNFTSGEINNVDNEQRLKPKE